MRIYKNAMLAIAAAIAAVAGNAAPILPDTNKSVSTPVEQLHFYRNRDGLTFANAWGDPATGPHSNYIKLAGNTASSLHVHTSNYYGVVISGIVSNQRRAQSDRPLGPGSYWFQKGGEPHITKCLSPDDCLIFVTSHGKFDIQPVGHAAPTASLKKPAR